MLAMDPWRKPALISEPPLLPVREKHDVIHWTRVRMNEKSDEFFICFVDQIAKFHHYFVKRKLGMRRGEQKKTT